MPTILKLEDGVKVLVNPGDHTPVHVHVRNKDRSLEVKIDISGDVAKMMRPAKDERVKTTPKFTRFALERCQSNLKLLQNAARIYYEAD